MAKQTLADEISSLYKPKEEYDVEDFDSGRPASDLFQHDDAAGEDSSEDVSDEELKKQHYVSSAKSKLRGQQGLNLGKRYTGDVVSREDLYRDDEEEEEEEEEGTDESDDDIEEKEEREDDDEKEEREDNFEAFSSDEQESEIDSELASDEDTNNRRLSKPSNPTTPKSDLIKKIMKDERTHLINRLSQSAVNDSLKGFAVQQQHKTYEKLIDVRIKFQKAVGAANKLPIDSASFDKYKSDESAELLKDTKGQLYELLKSLFKLRSQLDNNNQSNNNNSNNKATDIKAPKKRTFLEYAKTTANADKKLQADRSSILNKWSMKVQNSSGGTAINANKFKAINQSFEQQVQNNLSDMERLVKRTRLNRRQIMPIGYTPSLDLETSQSNGTRPDANLDDDSIIPEEPLRKKSQGQEIPYIFDDEDFYRVLLNDLVDRKVQTADPTSNITIVRSAQRANKLLNNVDTKASKGRKLRFHVQEQIANFETSTGGWKWNDDQIDEFFASLLGQKVNMKEDEDDEEDDEENGESKDEDANDGSEEISLANGDGIRLFG